MTDQPEHVKEPFVEYLEHLRDNAFRHRTAMHDLRRVQGLRMADASSAWRYVLPWCRQGDDRATWRAECLLMVAALFAGHQLSWVHRDDEGPVNLGASMAHLRRAHGQADWIDRQMEVLVTADRDELSARLVTIMALLAEHKVAVEWSVLLRDLLRWRQEGRVALNWARAYYARAHETEEEAVDAVVR